MSQRQHCTAHNKRGGPCGGWAIHGGRVCRMHGGAAPQVKKAARERLAAMVDPALDVLHKAMKMRSKGQPQPLAVVAARDILDRAGYKANDKVIIGGTGPGGTILVSMDPKERLKAEYDALSERLATGKNSGDAGKLPG